jgi:hypothetical protein
MSTVAERAREWFLLRDLQARRAKLPDELHVRTATTSRVSRRRREAAEALWLSGFPAEALRLASEAVELAREARRDAGLDAGEELTGALPALDSIPSLDDQVTKEHAARFRALVARQIRLSDEHPELELDAKQISGLRVTRIASVVCALLVAVALVAFAARGSRTLRAKGSASWDARFEAANAVDGNETTEWILPDRAPGWIEVDVVPRRKIDRIKLMNVRNPPNADRATKEFHVDVLDGGKVVKSFDGQFDAPSATPSWQTLSVGGVKGDRVRIEIRSWFLSGGGLAEIQVE